MYKKIYSKKGNFKQSKIDGVLLFFFNRAPCISMRGFKNFRLKKNSEFKINMFKKLEIYIRKIQNKKIFFTTVIPVDEDVVLTNIADPVYSEPILSCPDDSTFLYTCKVTYRCTYTYSRPYHHVLTHDYVHEYTFSFKL